MTVMPPCPQTIVSIRDMNKSYRRGSQTVPVLERITVEICEGEFLALMGPSGSGKSTLLNALVGHARALVSSAAGTTRDVLAVETGLGGMRVVVQDCAGMGDSGAELERAAHRLARQSAQRMTWPRRVLNVYSDLRPCA